MRFGVVLALASLSLLVVGCGGSKGSSPSKAVKPSVVVDWPTRTRGATGPSSALSVQFSLHPLNVSGSDIEIDGDRPAALTPTSTTYEAAETAKPGTWTLTGLFYSQVAGGGFVVGTVDEDVTIKADGTIANTDGTDLDVSFSSVIQSAVVAANQGVAIGATKTLTATAYNAQNQPIVVSPGSFQFFLAGTSTALTLNPNGDVTGVAAGSAQVTATINGVTSPNQTILVTSAAPAVITVGIDSTDIAYDASRNTVWVCAASTSTINPSKVMPVNASTGSVGAAIDTQNAPTCLALSGDANYLYVGGQGGTIVRIALDTNTVDKTISLPPTYAATQILAVPGTADTLAVVRVARSDSQLDRGTVIYDADVPRTNSVSLGHSIAINDAGTRIYGYQRFVTTASQYTTATIDGDGISAPTPLVTTVQGATNRICWLNGKIVADGGQVIDAETGAPIGTLPFTATNHVGAAIPGTNKLLFAAWDPKAILEYDLPTLASTSSFAPTNTINGSIDEVIFLGPGRAAFRTTGSATNSVYLVSGIP